MMTDGKKWCYLAVRSLPALLRGKTSNHNGDFYVETVFIQSEPKNLMKHERLCNGHDYSYLVMPTKGNKIIKYNHGEKSLKVLFIIYLDLESLLKKTHSCQNNPEKSSTEKNTKHETSGWAMIVKCSIDVAKSKNDYYRGVGCIEKLCKK